MADTPVSVFISYSRTDSAFVDRLEADLCAYGFITWVDRDRQHLESDADRALVIGQRILEHEAFIVTLSPDAIVSERVRRELAFAHTASRRIIPVIARPIEQTPVEIVNLQHIDLSADYASRLQEVRITLLKARDLPPVPRTVEPSAFHSSPAIMHLSEGLVGISNISLSPEPDIDALFMQAQAALAHESLDVAEILLQRVVASDQHFGNGIAAEELNRIRRQIEPTQIIRLCEIADRAHERGAWSEEIGALRALISRLSPNISREPLFDSNANPQTELTYEEIASEAWKQLQIARECQKWSWLYDNARKFIEANDAAAALLAVQQLWEKVPEYGDPASIVPSGLRPPSPTKVRDMPRSNSAVARLVEVEGPHTGAVYPILQQDIVIGRSEECDIFLEDLAVSRVHATVTHDPYSSFILQDENSANGTFVNGNRIIRYPLTDGDEVQIGATILVFTSGL